MQQDKDNIQKAAEIIKSGGVIAIPTDTVYGLSASIHNMEAIKQVFAIKGRDFKNPLIIHISDIKELDDIAYYDERAIQIAQNFWPGALTLILKRKLFNPEMELIRNGLPTVTVRIPNHRIPLEIIRLSKTPIISTSANLSGFPSPTTAEEVKAQLKNRVELIIDGGKSPIEEVKAQLKNRVELIIDGGKSPIGEASTILDLSSDTPEIVRQGTVTLEELKKFF